MKSLSLNNLSENARVSFLRFPMVILSAFAGTLIGIYLVEVQEVGDNLFPLINLMLCFALGIPLFFAAHIFIEKSKLKINFQLGIYLLAILTLVILYYFLPSQDLTHNTSLPYIRYAIYNACVHLLIAFIPIKELPNPSPFKILRSLIPVLVVIHSSFVSTIFSSSKFVRI